jgi:hypothetical protein
MDEIHTQHIINQPRDVVFAALIALEKWAEWFTLHGSWTATTPSTLVVDAEFSQQLSLRGLPIGVEHRWKAVQVREPELIELAGTGLAGSTGHLIFSLEERRDTTLLTAAIELNGPLIPRPLRAILKRQAQNEVRRSMHNLNNHLATTTAAASGGRDR